MLLLQLEQRHFRPGNYRKIIALTPDVRDDLQQYYGVPAGDIVVIPNGFSPYEFNLRRAAAQRAGMRAQLGYGEEDKVIIFVANESERKGLPALLRAVELLKDSRIRSAGGGPSRRKIHGSCSIHRAQWRCAQNITLPRMSLRCRRSMRHGDW